LLDFFCNSSAADAPDSAANFQLWQSTREN
jgi:hypothetical protein